MHAEIIAVGDEITSGQTLDTNTQWLAQRSEEHGARVLYHTTVGDELEGDPALMQRMVDGDWDEQDFLVVRPGKTIAEDVTQPGIIRAE